MREIISIDLSGVDRQLERMGAAMSQMPFAVSKSLNSAAFNARAVLVQSTWPSHMRVRNASFISAALRVESSSKSNLIVSITDAGAKGRGNLALHATGGIKTARGKIAVPQAFIRRGAHGITPSQLPANLVNSFTRGGAIFQRIGKGVRAHLRIAYALTGSALIKQDVPFIADFQTAIRQDLLANLPKAMLAAMNSSK